MKIAVLGTGVVGQTLSDKLTSIGHEVVIGTRDVKAALATTGTSQYGLPAFGEWHKNHPEIKVATYADASSFGELVINATNGFGSLNALEHAGHDNLKGKILFDVSNPLDFSHGMPPSLWVSNTDSLGEQIQRAFPETKVVKSLHTITASVMVDPSLVPGDHTVFLGGNDDEAKQKIRGLLKSFGWKDENILDLGDITTARGTEQMLPIWVRLMGTFQSPFFNFSIVKGQPPRA
jgi:8-hydroxy-5-deazaflavin:NADPH oxidoreductase